jgi:hypothetical protein
VKDPSLKGGLFRGGGEAQPRLLDVRSGAEQYSEYQHQVALVAWARWSAKLLRNSDEPECDRKRWALDHLHSIPNGLWLGADRRRAASVISSAKAAGLTPGVPDLRLDFAAQGYHGLYVEMKAGRNDLTPEQRLFYDGARAAGYEVIVAWSWMDAAREIVSYMNLIRFAPIPSR